MPLIARSCVAVSVTPALLCSCRTTWQTDTPEEVELKLKMLQIYNLKLNERERRRKFVLEREFYVCTCRMDVILWQALKSFSAMFVCTRVCVCDYCA